jgi:hypothetical protein
MVDGHRLLVSVAYGLLRVITASLWLYFHVLKYQASLIEHLFPNSKAECYTSMLYEWKQNKEKNCMLKLD